MKKQICKKVLRTLTIVCLAALLVTLFAACNTVAETATKYYSSLILDPYEWNFVGQEVSEAVADYRGECTYYENGGLKKIEFYGISELFEGETFVLEFDKSGKIIGGSYTYVVDGENVNETIVPTYDKKGNCIKVEYILSDNTVRSYIEYEYNENNNCISCKMYDGGSLIARCVYEYDQNGNRTKRIHYNEKNDKSEEFDFVFDENNNCIKQTNIIYLDDGAVLNWQSTEMDENGNVIKVTSYNSDGSIKNWREYEYAENGEWYKYTLYNADGTIVNIYQYNFDENGNQISHVTYDEQGNITKQEETDQNGNTIMSSYRNGKLVSQQVRDKNYKTLKSVDYNSDGEIIAWVQHEYDENGNRIKTTSYDADGKINEQSEYSSVDQKRIKRVTYDNDGKVRWIYVYEYNSEGEKSKDLLYNSDNELYEYTIYGQGIDGRIDKTYNADDVLVRTDEWKSGEREGSKYVALSTEFYPDGSIKNTTEYLRNPDHTIDTYYYENGKIQSITEYDEDWQVVKDINYDKNGNVIESAGGNSSGGNVSEPDPNMHFEYDANGNIIKITVTNDLGQITNISNFGADGKETSQIVYSYYDNGKVYNSTETIHGVGSTKIEYYENGNKKQEVTFNASGNLLVIIIYDENGNVTSTIDRTGNE